MVSLEGRERKAGSRPLQIFLRHDDVGELTPQFAFLSQVFEERGLPVSHQIIPADLSSECAAYLKERSAAQPSLYEFGQHGWTHRMEVNGRQVYYEFGQEVPYEEQLGRIERGKAALAERLGPGRADRLFTPPRHRYDRNTLRALRAMGFETFSASSYLGMGHRAAYALGRALGLSNLGRPGVPHHLRTRPDCGLFEASIAVAVDDGGRITTDVGAVLRAIEAGRALTPAIGLMFHSNAYREPDGRTFLARLADALLTVENARFTTIASLKAAFASEPPARQAHTPG